MNQTMKNQPAIMVGDYSELREHENRETRMVMVDGGLTVNRQTTEGGTSARVFDRGYWGFASTPRPKSEAADIVLNRAVTNARAMSRFGSKTRLVLPGDSYQGEQRINSKPRATTGECVSLLELLQETCKRRYPNLTSAKFMIHDETHHKALSNSLGSDVVNCMDRVSLYLTLSMENNEGRPVELTEVVSGKGGLADLNTSTNTMESLLENLYEHLQAKRQTVPVTGGQHTVVLSPELTGMLAHEAMGHPCEADIVLGGAVTGGLLGKQVASDCITMVDFAHS
jgi:TldD protein